MSIQSTSAVAELKAYMAENRDRVDRWLAECLPGPDVCPGQLAEAMRHSVAGGGKRLRPLMVLMAAELCDGHPEGARPAAVAVELVHAYSLVHDDLPAMDDDLLRRGRPSTHAMFGEALAILAGDALLTHAFTVLAEQIDDEAVAARCITELARAAGPEGMVAGQCEDLLAVRRPASAESLRGMHARKTGALINASLRMGALTARADASALTAVDAYGRSVGLAFQIADDLLGAEGGAKALGKPVGKDARMGKLTYPGLLGPEASRNEAEVLVDDACRQLAPFGLRAERLCGLARYIVERDR